MDALACECPPVPAGGRHLLLYFTRKGIHPACRAIGAQRCGSDGTARRKPSIVVVGSVWREALAFAILSGEYAQLRAGEE